MSTFLRFQGLLYRRDIVRGVFMKKLISVILSAVFVLAAFAPLYTAIGDSIERKSVAAFCDAVSTLTQKHDSNISFTIYDEDGGKTVSGFADRLIIKTDDKIKSDNAIDCIYGLDYAVLQYANQGDTLKEYDRLEALGYNVYKDNVVYAFDVDTLSSDSGQENAGTQAKTAFLSTETYLQKDLVVGVMDTGIDYNHSEFTDRYIHNPANFSSSGESGDPMDDQMHGTACASIVTQNTPENVKVKPYKVLDKDGGGTELNIIAGLEYILAEKDKPDIINMSLGTHSKSEDFAIIDDLLEQLVECGITVSVAAGNESRPTDFARPANCKSVITVASCDDNNQFSYFSNYGDAVDVTAPGEKIRTAALGGGYSSEHSGTSFSAPYVSAAAALVLLQTPDASPAEIKEIIKASAIDMGEEDRYYYGAGVLDINNLVNYLPYQTPEPDVKSGLYHEAQVIDFGEIKEGVLVYTTDRTTPSPSNGTEYTGPITIDSDTQLTYALINRYDYLSPIKTQHYVIQYYAPSSDFIMLSGVIMKYKGDKTNIIVPDKIGSSKPTALSMSLFSGSNLTGIVLPDSVTTLRTGCFQNSKKLRHIVAKGVTKLNGKSVFSGCEDLRNEVMPNLTTVTEEAFKYCSRLHSIDFGTNITELPSGLFYGAGLMHGDFPNAKDFAASNVFKGCPLFSCSIPNYTTLYSGFFYGCALLSDLEIGQVTEIRNSALYNCAFLKEFDASEVTTLSTDALSCCCIDNFYAPKITELPTKLGKYCSIRIIDMPNAQGSLGGDFLNCSMTEELYLEKATAMSEYSIRNAIRLNIVYLPNVTKYYEPYTSIEQADSLLYGSLFEAKAPLEVIWVPSAEIPKTINCYSTKLIYAPETPTVNLAVHGDTVPSVAVSDKVSQGNITVTNDEGSSAVFIAPNGSYVQQYSADETCGYSFASTDEVAYSTKDERAYFTYTTKNSDFSVPDRIVSAFWQNDIINKSRNEMYYGFLIDLVGDGVLNAKDYSILKKG